MSGIVTIQPSDEDYPERVRSAMNPPPTLYALGNCDLLLRAAVGICGSRDASEEALEWAFDFGCRAATEGKVLVSGHARGVDQRAHAGALTAGGSTIVVPAEGIGVFRVVGELRELTDDENFLVLSMFAPRERWQIWRAMERNRLIVALSDELWAVAPGDTGGTADAIRKCKRLHKPVHIQFGHTPDAPQSAQSALL